jgi:hypothetical protein
MASPARGDQRAARNEGGRLLAFLRQGPQIGARVLHRGDTGSEQQEAKQTAEIRRRPRHANLPNPSTLGEHLYRDGRSLPLYRNIGGFDGANDAPVRQRFSGMPNFAAGCIFAGPANQMIRCRLVSVVTIPPTRHSTAEAVPPPAG